MQEAPQTNPEDSKEAFDPSRILQKKILRKGFLRTAQITENLRVDFPSRIVLNRFSDRIAGFGSCFAINLKQALSGFFPHFYYERPICAHYSAESIASILEAVAGERTHTDDEWSSLNADRTDVIAHRYFRLRQMGPDAVDRLKQEMNRLDEGCRKALTHAQVVIVTLGTSRVLRLKSNGSLLGSLVGLIDEPYDSELLSVEQNITQLETILRCIRKLARNGMPHVIFTVSPQRYNWSYSIMGKNHGYFEHNLSKSILRVALEQLISKHHDLPLYYFPSFEMVIDELRLFDSMCHYDHLHIQDPSTPQFVAKRFIESSVAPELVRALPVIENLQGLLQEFGDLIRCGATPRDRILDESLKAYLKSVREHPVLEDHPHFHQSVHQMLIQLGRLDLAVDLALETDCPKPSLASLWLAVQKGVEPRMDGSKMRKLYRKLQEKDLLPQSMETCVTA